MKSYSLSSGQELCNQITLNQAGKLSGRRIASSPNPAGWFPVPWHRPWVTHPRWVTKLSPGSARVGVCAARFFFFFLNGTLFSGGDGLRWRGARGSPLLARKPDAWSHCLALPGKAGKASAGVIKQHAGAAGSEQAASEVPLDLSSRRESPWTPNIAELNQKVPGGCLSSLVHPPLGLHTMALRDGFGARSSRMKRLFPPPSSPPKPSTSSAMLRREQRLTVSRLQ